MAMMKIDPVKAGIAGAIVAVFTAVAWATTREEDIVCQATQKEGEYKVFYAKSGTELGTAQMIRQEGAKEPFGSIKVKPRLGPPGGADILVVKAETGVCELYLREDVYSRVTKHSSFRLLEGQRQAGVPPKKQWFSEATVPPVPESVLKP